MTKTPFIQGLNGFLGPLSTWCPFCCEECVIAWMLRTGGGMDAGMGWGEKSPCLLPSGYGKIGVVSLSVYVLLLLVNE